jgi:group I intron endonuclease
MNNYSTSKIYKLINNVDNKIYIGSTYNSLSKRLWLHRNRSKTRTSKVYQHFRSIGMSNVSIVNLEHYPCDNKYDLLCRERHWIEELKPELNTQIPIQTPHEAKAKLKQDVLCACGTSYKHGHKADHLKTSRHINRLHDKIVEAYYKNQ